MAGRMNRFGCTALAVANIFKTGAYAPSTADFGGDAAIEQFIDSCCDEIIQNMPEEMFLALSLVELEKVETRAVANQSTVTVGIKPILSGKTHVWAGQPSSFREKPRLATDLDMQESFADPELVPANELDSTKFTVATSTGVITFTAGNLLSVNDEVYATYEPDASTLSIPSLSTLLAEGAAYLVGFKHYARGSSEWSFIDQLQERYAKKLESLREGDWLPPETRLMKFWAERIPEADKKASVQVGRLRRG
jgi:hypothetical protein